MTLSDFDPDEYADVEGLSSELAAAWDRFRRTAGWPVGVDAAVLEAFAEEAKALGGFSSDTQVAQLLEQHSGFDIQDYNYVLDALGFPYPED